MKGSASVRISQILVGVVLAFMAAILYRTSTDTIARRSAEDTRSLGARVGQREAVRVDQTIAALQTLKDSVDIRGFSSRRFAAAARSTMRTDPMIDVIDYFDADYAHVAHVERGGAVRLGAPSSAQPPKVSSGIIDAVDLVLSESSVTRTIVSSHALRIRGSSVVKAPAGRLSVYVAQPIAHRFDVVGTIVARVDVQRLLVDDLATVLPPARYVLDDGSGRLEIGPAAGAGKSENDAQTITIPFADRAWTLTLLPPVEDQTAKPWLFALLWLAAWLAVCVPIEVVGQISRRVQSLNAGLEASVASRTQELQASVAEIRTLAAVVESVHEGVMLLDPDFTVRYANDALCRELDCSLKDIVGKPAYAFAPLRLSRAQLEEWAEAVRARGYAYLETERATVDGTKYWAGITVTRHLEDGDEGEGLIAVSRDVTDRRRLVEELERQMRVRADFIGTASHELRTPVTTLRTLTALLRVKVQPRYAFADEDGRLFGMLDFETRRLANLVDDLLEVAKVDASEAPLAEQDVDVCDVLRTEADTTFGIEAREVPPVELQLPAGPLLMRADEGALRRIIVNLVGNARKFTPPAGLVRVVAERVGGRVRLIVSDTGIGIPEKDLPHVFERFYRVDRPGTEIRGTGLGLSIVARLVERMRGSISIASEVGKGTTVTVEMPAARLRAAAGD